MHYTTPSGDPLIHLAPDPVFMPNFPGWGFHRFNPWRQRFDEVIQRVIEAGLIDFWKQVATSYRVTIQLVANLPLTSRHEFRYGLAWPGLA